MVDGWFDQFWQNLYQQIQHEPRNSYFLSNISQAISKKKQKKPAIFQISLCGSVVKFDMNPQIMVMKHTEFLILGQRGWKVITKRKVDI